MVHDICTFAVLCSVTWPFLSLHSCFWRTLRVILYNVGRDFKWNWAVRLCYGKVLQVIGLHDFHCYLHVTSWSLTPMQFALCLCIVFSLVSIASYVLSLHMFAFKGQNMKLTVKMLLTCIVLLTCVVMPGLAVIRTVCKDSRRFLSQISWGSKSTLHHWLALIAKRNQTFSIRDKLRVHTTMSLCQAAECLAFSQRNESR